MISRFPPLLEGVRGSFFLPRHYLISYLSFFIFLLSSYSVVAQSNPLNLPQKFFFNQAYIFEYSSSVIPEGEYGHKGEMTIYYNEKSNCWLFTDECYGVSFTNVQWVLGFPNGIYLTGLSDDEGRKSLLSDTMNFSKKIAQRLDELGNFEESHKNTGTTRTYCKDAMGFPMYNAFHYSVLNPKSRDVTEQFITSSRIMASSVYFFNDRDADLKLPVKFPTDIPMGMLVLEDKTKTVDGEFHFKLKEVKVTDYAVNLKEYW